MQKTRHPVTSRLAHKEVKRNGWDISIQAKIMRALYQLKNHRGIKTQIASKLRLPEEKVHKRLSELEEKGIIEKTGNKHMSKVTGQWQQEWQLVGTPESITKK